MAEQDLSVGLRTIATSSWSAGSSPIWVESLSIWGTLQRPATPQVSTRYIYASQRLGTSLKAEASTCHGVLAGCTGCAAACAQQDSGGAQGLAGPCAACAAEGLNPASCVSRPSRLLHGVPGAMGNGVQQRWLPRLSPAGWHASSAGVNRLNVVYSVRKLKVRTPQDLHCEPVSSSVQLGCTGRPVWMLSVLTRSVVPCKP